jgi:hypothetical protein
MIKADSNQKDPQFIKVINNGQRHYKQFIKNAKILADLPDIQIIELYIKMFETVIGIFRDTEYELGWGYYLIKTGSALTRIVRTGKPETVGIGVIPCRMLEEAVVFSQLYGDIKRSN